VTHARGDVSKFKGPHTRGWVDRTFLQMVGAVAFPSETVSSLGSHLCVSTRPFGGDEEERRQSMPGRRLYVVCHSLSIGGLLLDVFTVVEAPTAMKYDQTLWGVGK